ncbi:MAG: hypothetical protein KF801_05850 [Cryobacterium sp.]|nr:hypothetical protein [Cryobacterium sp.]
MADDTIDYSRSAGHVVFPRNPADLVSTSSCPACFAVLSSTVCSVCGLDLGHPDAAKLYEASVAAARTLDERLAIIGKMRFEAAHGVAAVPQESPLAAAPISRPGAQPATAQPSGAQPAAAAHPAVAAPPVAPPAAAGAAASPTPATAAPAPSSPTAVPRRSSVQVTLLIVGVSLLSVAAIFFLVYAYINFGIVWRSVIIGAITIAAIAGATLLRRRGLRATAEGISAFGVVLIYLDAYAIRANNFFDAGRSHNAIYWGIVVIATAIIFLAWSRVSTLRIPNIVGFGSFPIGVGILVAGLARQLPDASTAFLVFASIALAGLVHRLALRPGAPAVAERAVVFVITLIALFVSFAVCLAAFPHVTWAPAVCAVVLAAIAALHVWMLSASFATSRLSRVVARIFAALFGIGAAAAVGFSATRISAEQFGLIVPAVAGVAVALLLDAGVTRLERGTTRSLLTVAGWSAAGVAALELLAPVISTGATAIYASAGTGIPSWLLQPTDPVREFSSSNVWAVVCLAIVTALAAAVWASRSQLASPARRTALAWGSTATIVAAVPELRTQWAVMAGWLAVAAASLVASVIVRSRASVSPRYRAPLLTAAIVSGSLGYLTGLASTTTWWIGTATVVGMLIAARPLVTRPGAKATLLGIGLGLALLSVGSVADQLSLDAGLGFQVSVANRLAITAFAAGAVLLGAGIPGGGVSATDRRVEFWIAAGVATVTVPTAATVVLGLRASDRPGLLIPDHWALFSLSVVLLVASAAWVVLRGNQSLRPERIVASIASTPILALGASSLVRLIGRPDFAATIAPMTAAVLAASASLAVTLMRPTMSPRWTRELGVALVGVLVLWVAVRDDNGLTWLVFLLAAVAALLLAIDRGGLFSARSARHHIGWLGLALATAGLWWRLSSDRVAELEFYVIPLTLALVGIAVLIARAAVREQPPRVSAPAPAIALGGLLVSVLPLGANAATGSVTTAVVIFAASAVLLLAGSAISWRARWQGFADAAAAAGAIGVVVVAVGRALSLPSPAPERDLWLAAAFVLLVLAAFSQARSRSESTARLRTLASQALVIVAMVAVIIPELPAIREPGTGGIRAETLVLLFSAIHVVAFLLSRVPLTKLVAVIAIAFAVVSALAGVWSDTLHPVEFASIPIAAALIATGFVHLRSTPSARSWAWLAPGVTVLLVTSLIATLDERPLWRLVGLGVVGIAVIVVGVAWRMQAPFALGVIVVLIHAVATFLPQLRLAYESLPWWLWLGAGGVLLIVLAARYEQRIANLKSVALRFAALR